MSCAIVGFIFARGGSKGVPRKNIRLLAGKPLIAYAIETARASQFIDRVVVSTDDTEIAAVAKTYGADVPFMRPAELAGDAAPEWLAWQHAIRTMQANGTPVDLFVSIPPTAPLRSVTDVDTCIRIALESDTDMVITVRPAERNPYFNMVMLDAAGYAQLVIPPDTVVERRQSAPVVYDMTTVAYVARAAFVLKAHSMFEGKLKAVCIAPERALDIDSELDLKIAEFLLNQRATGQL